MEFEFDTSWTKSLIVSFHFSGGSVVISQDAGATGATAYTSLEPHTSQDNPQPDTSGQTSAQLPWVISNTCVCVKHIDSFSYAKYSILDTQLMPLILGTGIGAPFNVTSVIVWQASNANNATIPAIQTAASFP